MSTPLAAIPRRRAEPVSSSRLYGPGALSSARSPRASAVSSMPPTWAGCRTTSMAASSSSMQWRRRSSEERAFLAAGGSRHWRHLQRPLPALLRRPVDVHRDRFRLTRGRDDRFALAPERHLRQRRARLIVAPERGDVSLESVSADVLFLSFSAASKYTLAAAWQLLRLASLKEGQDGERALD